MEHRVMSFKRFSVNEEAENLDLDDSILDSLVTLVGSEEDVEAAAEAAYDDLKSAFDAGEAQIAEGDVPEKLAVSALILKLVEAGKLGPDEADSFLEEAFAE